MKGGDGRGGEGNVDKEGWDQACQGSEGRGGEARKEGEEGRLGSGDNEGQVGRGKAGGGMEVEVKGKRREEEGKVIQEREKRKVRWHR